MRRNRRYRGPRSCAVRFWSRWNIFKVLLLLCVVGFVFIYVAVTPYSNQSILLEPANIPEPLTARKTHTPGANKLTPTALKSGLTTPSTTRLEINESKHLSSSQAKTASFGDLSRLATAVSLGEISSLTTDPSFGDISSPNTAASVTHISSLATTAPLGDISIPATAATMGDISSPTKAATMGDISSPTTAATLGDISSLATAVSVTDISSLATAVSLGDILSPATTASSGDITSPITSATVMDISSLATAALVTDISSLASTVSVAGEKSSVDTKTSVGEALNPVTTATDGEIPTKESTATNSTVSPTSLVSPTTKESTSATTSDRSTTESSTNIINASSTLTASSPTAEGASVSPSGVAGSSADFPTVHTQSTALEVTIAATAALSGNVQPLYVTSAFTGRLGNQMFIYAALIGIARAQNRTLFIKNGTDLEATFQITHLNDSIDVTGWQNEAEAHYATFDPKFMKMTTVNKTFHGFFQSWRYFHHNQDEVRREFTFKDEILRKAQEHLQKFRNESNGNLLVGVHVRRGDYLYDYNVKLGYGVPHASYFHNAFRTIRELFRDKNFTFLIASDDLTWCEENLKDPDVRIVTEATHLVHFAVLANCDHVVLSGGTYGWWAAWLSPGVKIYYSKFVVNGSWLEDGFTREDYYPPDWIGLANMDNLTSPTAALTSPTAALTSPTAALTSPTAALTSPTAALTSPTAALTSPTAALTSPTAALTSPTAALTSPTAALTSLTADLTSPTAALTSPTAALTSPTAALTSPTAALTSTTAALTSPTAALTSTTAALTSPIAALTSTTAALTSPTAALTSTTAASGFTSPAAG